MSFLDRKINYYPPMLQPQVDNLRAQLISQIPNSEEIIDFGEDPAEIVHQERAGVRLAKGPLVEATGYFALACIANYTSSRFLDGSLTQYRDWNESIGDINLLISTMSIVVAGISALTSGWKFYDTFTQEKNKRNQTPHL